MKLALRVEAMNTQNENIRIVANYELKIESIEKRFFVCVCIGTKNHLFS